MIRKLLFSCLAVGIICCSKSNSEKGAANSGTEFSNGASTLFSKMSEDQTSVSFRNELKQTVDFNFMNYMYVFMGGGVAVGDVDNDGLEDIYFVSNLGPNKLYKNKGNFNFENITESSGTQDSNGFSTGVSMMDVNNDGWMDIYVCKAGSLKDDNGRRNLLFVNQKDGTFKEEAASWGLDDPAYSTQAYTLDYDKDGDLDIYLVNHRYDFVNNGKINSKIQRQIEEITTDQLYRNDGNHFSKVTAEAGLLNKAWGLSAVISDFNEDGWEDIYVANDFWEPDALYINQQDGTFKNEILSRINHISTNSMGSDYADLNNDARPDLIVVDMLSENYTRSKENMASMSTENFMTMVRIGYHHTYMANMLQFNLGNGKFRETSQLSGVTKTDWSWAPLIADFDGDGFKDLFVTNGIDRDYTNQDARKQLYQIMNEGLTMKLEDVLAMIPSERLNNYIYKNKGDLTFNKMIEEWGLDDPGYSNGAAYSDLDNDGDLDLITNNLYDAAGIYRNNSNENFIKIALKGSKNNPLAIGAKVYVKDKDRTQFQELYMARGFESTVTKNLLFGVGKITRIDELIVLWPDGKISRMENLNVNKEVELDHAKSKNNTLAFEGYSTKKNKVTASEIGINYQHKENEFNDYTLQLLIPQKQSTKGTGIVKGDVNGDGLDDFFVGNASGAAAALYIQAADGTFSNSNIPLWKAEAKYEDANALFFDADGDGDMDLYVVSAGYELSLNNTLLQDRLYVNDGVGNFKKNANALPQMLTSGKSIAASDYDHDGDLDLFVGGNVVPGKYPTTPRSYLLNNNRGKFTDVLQFGSDLSNAGMISDALFTDYDKDGDEDLLLVGEWMAPTFFENFNGTFEKAQSIAGLEGTEGWWFSVAAADFDQDGDDDYILGNIGMNNKFQPKKDKPLYIYAKDFDNNGTFDVAMSKINNGKLVPVRGKECSSEQNPFLLEKIATYKEFASMEFKDIYGEDKLQGALHLTAHMFESIYVENLGNGAFKYHKLPNVAQTGPTLATLIKDVNKDGHLDVLSIGAIYDAEVETIRYDGNYGYVLLGDGKGEFTYSEKYDPFIDSDAKDMIAIRIKGEESFIVVSNNAPLEIFNFLP